MNIPGILLRLLKSYQLVALKISTLAVWLQSPGVAGLFMSRLEN